MITNLLCLVCDTYRRQFSYNFIPFYHKSLKEIVIFITVVYHIHASPTDRQVTLWWLVVYRSKVLPPLQIMKSSLYYSLNFQFGFVTWLSSLHVAIVTSSPVCLFIKSSWKTATVFVVKVHLSLCQILKRGCHVNDRDGLTDMTLLHYSCKAGAHGVGKMEERMQRHVKQDTFYRLRRRGEGEGDEGNGIPVS